MRPPEKACVKVSVVIPVRNGERTLPGCLSSVLCQDFAGYEVIVVDNASTDGTRDVIEGFMENDGRVRYAFEGHVSRGAARNRGIAESRGGVILMTDADCEVPRGWIFSMAGPIMEGEDVVQGGEEMASRGFWQRSQQEADERFMEMHAEGGYVDHLDTKNAAFRKSALLDAGLFDGRVKTFEDFEFKLRLRRRGYRALLLRGVRVMHRHREDIASVFRRRMEMGKWIAIIRRMHAGTPGMQCEEMAKSLRPFNFLSFFPWTLSVLLRRGPRAFAFEAVTGTAWRIGAAQAALSGKDARMMRAGGVGS